MVVMTHVSAYLVDNHIASFPPLFAGNAGVELFFLVSGFVMIVSSYDENGARLSWNQFLSRRLQRIIPLYWFFLTLKLLVFWAHPGVFKSSSLNTVNAVCSYLFLPSYNSQHLLYPVIFIGWTLNFEMFFYYAFAVCLAFAISPFRWLTVAFAIFAGLGLMGIGGSAPAASLLSPLLLEFVGGMWLAKVLVLSSKRIPARIAILAPVMGFFLIGLTELLSENLVMKFRVILWALPAAAVLFGFVALEDRGHFRRRRFALIVGDASYSIYLTHVQIIPFVIAGVQGRSYSATAATAVFLGTVAMCIVCGILVYFAIERPMTRFVRSLFEPTRKVQSVAV